MMKQARKQSHQKIIINSFHWKQNASVKCLQAATCARCSERWCALPMPRFLRRDGLLLGNVHGCSCRRSEDCPVTHRQRCNTSEYKEKRHITALPEHAASEVQIQPVCFRCLTTTFKRAALTPSTAGA